MSSTSPTAPLDRKVIVTGATRGVGRAVALAFARTGASVGIVARTPQALAETAQALRLAGAPTVVFAAADTSQREQIQAAMAQLIGELGGVDQRGSNAGQCDW
jgi:NAD(P)-dependent dehydrogenase (short-subunit alcohol dehydrogenase family)